MPSKPATIATSTTPANILPKRRKANESIFESSEINSSKPTKKSMAPKNGTFEHAARIEELAQIANSLRAEHQSPESSRTEIKASANVKFKSTEIPRKNGTRI